MIFINRIADSTLDFKWARGVKIYYNNFNSEPVWQKINLHDDLETISKKVYFLGNPFQKSEKFLRKEFYENGILKAQYRITNGKIRSNYDNLPAIIEWSIDGKMSLKIYNFNLDNEMVLSYD